MTARLGRSQTTLKEKLGAPFHPHQAKEEEGTRMQVLVVMLLVLWGSKRDQSSDPERSMFWVLPRLIPTSSHHVLGQAQGWVEEIQKLRTGLQRMRQSIHLSTCLPGGLWPKK